MKTGVTNAQLELEHEYGRKARLETSVGRYEMLSGEYGGPTMTGRMTDSEEDSSDSEEDELMS